MRNPLAVLIAAALVIVAAADTISSPKSTAIIERGLQTGFSPKPTTAALLGVRLDNLFERQVSFDTCGYYNGYPQTCAAGYACVTNDDDFAAGCCPSSDIQACTLYTSCLDYDASCPECYGDSRVGSCTNILYPSCAMNIWDYATRYTEWYCATIGGIFTLDVYPDEASITSFRDTASATDLISAATVTDSSTGGGNGNENGINGDGNTQNDGNTYNYYGNGAAGGSSWDNLTSRLRLMLLLQALLALFHGVNWA